MRGRVDYRELELLPTPAELEIQLVKVSLEGGKEEVLRDLALFNPGQVPIDFELAYAPEAVDPEHDYVVRANITGAGRGPLFRTTKLFPVELWEEVERIASVPVPVPVPEESEEYPAAPPERDLLDIGRIVLTKVPRAEVAVVLPLPEAASLRGRIHLPAQALLPPGSNVQVRLVASSEVDSTEKDLATWEREDPGQSPIEFELAYTPDQIVSADKHSVRVLVTKDGERLFLTTALYAVDLSRELVRMRVAAEDGAVPTVLDVGAVLLTLVPRPVEEEAVVEGQAPPEAAVIGRLDTAVRADLPEGARVWIRLMAVAHEGGTEATLVEWESTEARSFPLAFRLVYETARIDQEHAYSVRCLVDIDGERLYLTTALYPVDLWADVQRMKRAQAEQAEVSAELDAGRVMLTTVPRASEPSEPEPDVGILRGRVRYLEREVLPLESRLRVRLVATNERELTDEVIAELVKDNPGQVPIEFQLEYDAERVDADLRYSIRAEILGVGGRKLFMTTALMAVELDGAEGVVDAGTILLTRVPR